MTDDDPQGETLDQKIARLNAQHTDAPETLDAKIARLNGGGGPAIDRLHALSQSGQLAAHEQARTATDPERYALDTQPSYTDRLGMMAERGASSLPLGSTVMTATRRAFTAPASGGLDYSDVASGGKPHLATTGESWNDAAAQVAKDAEEGGANAPGVRVPILGSRLTLADAPSAAAGFRALMRAAPTLGAVKAGATFAGATRATQPQDESLMSRAGGTALSAAEGAAIPSLFKTLELANVARTANKAAPLTDNLVTRGVARDAATAPAYDAVRNLGDVGTSPALDDLMQTNRPIKTAFKDVLSDNPSLSKLSPTDARVLVRVGQKLNDKAWAAKNSFDLEDASRAYTDAVDALTAPKGASLADAETAYREPSQQMDAVTRGNKAMQYAASPKGAPAGAVEDSPAAFRLWAQTATPEQLTAAREGINARLQVEPKTTRFGLGPVKLPAIPSGPSQALSEAPGLLKAAGGSNIFSQFGDMALGDKSMTLGEALARARASTSSPAEPTLQGMLPRNPSAVPTAGAAEGPPIPTGNGSLRSLPNATARIALPRNQSAVPTAGALEGPAIPTRGVPPTDAEMFGGRIPPSRQLPRGPLVTPKPLPATAGELLDELAHDPELRRRLGLP